MTEQRCWEYVEPGPDEEPVYHRFTEEEILRDYYPWWCAQVLKVHRAPLMTEQNCIDDFVVVNWATEVDCGERASA